jgi:hypothetical protein
MALNSRAVALQKPRLMRGFLLRDLLWPIHPFRAGIIAAITCSSHESEGLVALQ